MSDLLYSAGCMLISRDSSGGADWDSFVESSNDGTLFHTQEFLRYHGPRFAGTEHFLEIYRKQRKIGVWPVVISEKNNNKYAFSPYGGSYGGPALKDVLSLSASRDVINAIVDYLAAQGVCEFRVTLAPRACSNIYSDTFRFALLERGFFCVNRDIASIIPIDKKLPEYSHFSSLRAEWERRSRRAKKSGVEIRHRVSIDDFWVTLEATFQKHGKQPTHSREELSWLAKMLPNKVFFSCAYMNGHPIAGVCYFVQNRRVISTFYLCQNPEYQATQAQSALLLDGLLSAQSGDFSWIDLGTSSVNMTAYDSIFRFKETLGSIGQFRESYAMNFSK